MCRSCFLCNIRLMINFDSTHSYWIMSAEQCDLQTSTTCAELEWHGWWDRYISWMYMTNILICRRFSLIQESFWSRKHTCMALAQRSYLLWSDSRNIWTHTDMAQVWDAPHHTSLTPYPISIVELARGQVHVEVTCSLLLFEKYNVALVKWTE